MNSNSRQAIHHHVLSTTLPHLVLELATGVGKTKLALDKLQQFLTPESRLLIVIPRNVLIQNWKDEFTKWGYTKILSRVTFTTYVSLPKHAGSWGIVIFDEAHHLSERCQEVLTSFAIAHAIFLSATLKREHKDFITSYCHHRISFITVSAKKAIDNEILPDPAIILIPLELDTEHQDILLEKRKPKTGQEPLIIPYEQRWNYRSYKGPLSFQCTQRQYYTELSNLIEWFKKKNYMSSMRNMWLHKCGERLHWLSMCKLPFTKQIMKRVKSRYIVFCNTIAESEALGIPSVNSQVGFKYLRWFNEGKIDRLAAVNCLNEGVNCTDCRTGIFSAINSSDIMQVQKVGRLLRHPSPQLIIPYFRNTREEEIVNKWMQNFNNEFIQVKTISEL